jgi:hypothetical protein
MSQSLITMFIGKGNIPLAGAPAPLLLPPTGATLVSSDELGNSKLLTVGILGAGAFIFVYFPDTLGLLFPQGPGGLYAAFLLDHLNIPFKVIEARGRLGGRLFTHTFPDQTEESNDYFDVGAMRFPKIPAMRHLWVLLNHPSLGLREKLRPFLFEDEAGNTLLSYNNVTARRSDVGALDTNDTFNAQAVIRDALGFDAQVYIMAGHKAIMDDVVGNFAPGIYQDMENIINDLDRYANKGDSPAWRRMMEHDHLSVRAYMSTIYRPSNALRLRFNLPDTAIPTDVINWYETRETGTGMFDRSLTKYVLEAIAFGRWKPAGDSKGSDGKEAQTEWFCIEYVASCFSSLTLKFNAPMNNQRWCSPYWQSYV